MIESISDHRRVERLAPPHNDLPPIEMVLDTDTYNEIDDQFALVYAILSPDRLKLDAVYAAPFVNERASTPEFGMRKSHEEIQEVYSRLPAPPAAPIYEGSTAWMSDHGNPVDNPASRNLVDRAMARHADDPPLYVVAIGAPTNVSSAIAMCPEIIDRITVVWLGGHEKSHHSAREFNLEQDVLATRTLLDSGVPLVRVPCLNVAKQLRTTVSEMNAHLAEKNAMCDFLLSRFRTYEGDQTPLRLKWWSVSHIAYSKEIWDVSAVAWLVNPDLLPSKLTPSPILTDSLTWSEDPSRHLVRELTSLNRDAIFGDLFHKLTSIDGY